MPARPSVQKIEGPFGELLISPDTRGKSAPHFHRSHAIGVARSGGGSLFAMGREWRHGVGMVVVTNPFEAHWGRPFPGGLDYSLLYPRPAWLRELAAVAARPGRTHFAIPVIEDEALAGQLALAFDEIGRGGGDELLREAAGRLFHEHAVEAPASGQQRAADPTTQPAIGGEGGIAGLAADAGLSRAYYSRAYRKRVGLSPLDHRRQGRVLAARSMIEGGASLAEAAADAGFADQAHMTRQFRQILGLTPAAYRP